MSNNFLEKIFSVKSEGYHKVIAFCGLKIKYCNINYLIKELEKHKAWSRELTLESFLKVRLIESGKTYQEFISDLFKSEKLLCSVPTEGFVHALKNYKKLFSKSSVTITSKPVEPMFDKIIMFGTQANNGNINVINNAIINDTPLVIAEQAFLSTILYQATGIKNVEKTKDYSSVIGFIFDNQGAFFDARRTNYLEQMLNDKNLVITEEQRIRARKCIDKIIENHLSKYNNQPIYEPRIGQSKGKKVLVVDQTYRDASIRYGLASGETFNQMLDDAVAENQDADIIVKTHPDTKVGAGGYYTYLKQEGNIYPMKDLINPISLLKYVDKVYVCTSQFGFEALMCGKEVHVYGMPFYAGWGLTVDKQKCSRRTNTRTLEEIFYITYIIYSHWINPKTFSKCEIEEAMDYLIRLREEYFEERNISNA